MGRQLDDILEAYIDYTQQSESPTNYHIWCCLSMVASVLRRQVWLDMGYFRIYPNMYVVLVGPPGKCRKTVAINIATSLIADMPEIRISADAITREALIRAIKNSETTTTMDGGKVYFHSSLTIISKELSVFLGTGNHDLLALLTDLYDCPPKWEYRTKSSGIDTIYNVWLNMLAASTPSWLVGSIPLTAIGGGFTSRVIFVVGKDVRHKNALPVITEKEVELREKLQHDLEQVSLMKGQMVLSEHALERYIQWYNEENEPLDDQRFWGYSERRHIHMLKVAMILNACKTDSNIITLESVDKSIQLLNEVEEHMVEAFGSVGRSEVAPDIDAMLEYLKLKGKATRREMLQALWRDVSAKNFNLIINTLIEMGLVEQTMKDGEIFYVYKGEEGLNYGLDASPQEP